MSIEETIKNKAIITPILANETSVSLAV